MDTESEKHADSTIDTGIVGTGRRNTASNKCFLYSRSSQRLDSNTTTTGRNTKTIFFIVKRFLLSTPVTNCNLSLFLMFSHCENIYTLFIIDVLDKNYGNLKYIPKEYYIVIKITSIDDRISTLEELISITKYN